MGTSRILFLFIICLSIFNEELKGQTDVEFNLIWEESLFPNNPYTVEYDQLGRPYFYVANDVGGLLIYKENALGHEKLLSFGIENWDSLQVMNLVQKDNLLFLALGSFFKSDGSDLGMAIIDVSDPENAKLLDYWTLGELRKGSAIVIVEGDYAFLGAMNDGVHIFDRSDPTEITHIAHIIPDLNYPIPNPNDTQEPNARGMAIKDDYLFVCFDAGGIRVIDIKDVFNPEEVSRYINESLLNVTQQAYNNIIIHQDYAYTATDYCGLEILDISDPLDIKLVSWWNPWNCESLDNFWINSPGHTNELAFLPGYEGDVLMINGNDSELLAVDVENVTQPRFIDGFGEVGDMLRTWGFGVKKDTLMAAYYFTLLPWLSSQAMIKEFEIRLPLSLNEIKKQSFNLMPNPASEELRITLPGRVHSSVQYRIVNTQGLENSNGSLFLNQNECIIPLNSIKADGLYFLQLYVNDKFYVEKFFFKSTK